MPERAHILVVDDDRELRDTLREVLEDLGYVVTSAEDGLDALSQLRGPARRPDLILLDLQMPNLDGEGFRSEQLKREDIAEIPVALLTADQEGKSKAAALHTDAYLSKPLKLLELMSVIPRVIGEKQAASAGRR
jgi:CheY-like chemotaxis protein